MSCRVCGADRTTLAGRVEYFQGYAYDVLDCAACGCRQTRHDPAVYDRLHESGALDYYAAYRDMAAAAQALFVAGDRAGLRRLLEPNRKYRFAMDAIDRLPPGLRVLEIGCSRGYLTAYALLAGARALGVDASDKALASARASFGDAFLPQGSPEIASRGPYDLIVHVGLIGCVADPMGLTRELLGWLAPGGRLAFNAPNLDALALRDQLWFDTAPPPDLVTLFPQGFWARRFGNAAQVTEEVERRTPRASAEIALARAAGQRWKPPIPRAFEAAPAPEAPKRSAAIRGLSRLAELTGLARLARPVPTEFGLFVTMRPRSARLKA